MSEKIRYLLTIFLISILCGCVAKETSYLIEYSQIQEKKKIKQKKEGTVFLSLELTDNTKIKGKTSQMQLPVFVLPKKIMIPLEQVSSIQFDDNRENAIINFRNGDKLTAVLDVDGLEVETIFGKIKVNINQVKKIIVSNKNNVSEEGLVAYYPFNGNANDESEEGNDGIIYGAALTTDRFGNQNSAYSFNGMNNYVVVPNPSGLPVGNADRTMAAWFKTSVSNNLALFLMSYGASGTNLACGLYVENGKLIYSSWGLDANIYSSGINYADNNWHHAVVTHSSSTGNVMYIDGVAVGKNTTAFATSSGTKFQIGLWVNNTNYFNGIIDEVSVYNRAFSESEVKELYNSDL